MLVILFTNDKWHLEENCHKNYSNRLMFRNMIFYISTLDLEVAPYHNTKMRHTEVVYMTHHRVISVSFKIIRLVFSETIEPSEVKEKEMKTR